MVTSLVGSAVWVRASAALTQCTNLRDGCAKPGMPMNLGRLLTGIALRQIDEPAAKTEPRSLDLPSSYMCTYRFVQPAS